MTKKEQVRIRLTTYKPPDPLVERCDTCENFHNPLGHTMGSCIAVYIRNDLQRFTCNAYGWCQLWTPKEKTP